MVQLPRSVELLAMEIPEIVNEAESTAAPDGWMTLREARDMLGTGSIARIRAWIKGGIVEGVRVVEGSGFKWFVNPEQVRAHHESLKDRAGQGDERRIAGVLVQVDELRRQQAITLNLLEAERERAKEATERVDGLIDDNQKLALEVGELRGRLQEMEKPRRWWRRG